MTENETTEKDIPDRDRRRRLLGVAVAISAGLLFVVMVTLYYAWYAPQLGPAQPIPFSHRIHVTERGISCLMCHTGVVDTDRATIPPLQTCMLCHENIIITYPQVADLRRHYEENRPVEWVRVNDLPEFVYFTHAMHLNAGIDCASCHGDVAHMDRVKYEYKFEMGLCMQCHRDYRVSTDCFTCHR